MRCLSIASNDGFQGMLNLKNIFRNTEFLKRYRIGFLSISAFTCLKQIEEKRTKNLSHYN